MHRTLVVSLALLAIARSPAVAQTCVGLGSHSSGQMQVTGQASVSELYNTFGASFGYGIPGGVFGNATLSTTSYDAVDGSELGLGAQAGYQMSVARGKAQVCPVASFGVGMGPDDDALGLDRSTTSGSIGLTVGTTMGASPRLRIVPNAGLGVAYRKDREEVGGTSADASETYGLAQVGVGLIFNQNIAVRSSVSIPVGSDVIEDPAFGLTVGVNFGSKGVARRR